MAFFVRSSRALLPAAVLAVAACAPARPPASAPPTTTAATTGAPAGRVPNVPLEALAGNWLFAVKMGDRTIEGSLHISVERGVLAGTWTSSEGREFELSKIEIDGDGVSWESDGPTGHTRATGKIEGTSMKGTMKRVARSRDSSSGEGGGSGNGSGSGTGSGEPSDGTSGSSGSGGGHGGRGHGMGGRGGHGRSGSGGTVTWTAYKSVPPVETPGSPAPAATPGPS